MSIKNRFGTLGEALDSEGLNDIELIGISVGYNQILNMARNGKYISVTRFEDGFYERPIHYSTQMDDFTRVISALFSA